MGQGKPSGLSCLKIQNSLVDQSSSGMYNVFTQTQAVPVHWTRVGCCSPAERPLYAAGFMDAAQLFPPPCKFTFNSPH